MTGTRHALFGTGYKCHQYDVSPDGQRFLINAAESSASPLTVVINWPAAIAGIPGSPPR